MKAPCPICRTPAQTGPANRFRPFCSERCQLLDLGRWLDETYVIPGEPAEIPTHREEDER